LASFLGYEEKKFCEELPKSVFLYIFLSLDGKEMPEAENSSPATNLSKLFTAVIYEFS
jgi:hypothetical protein